MKHFPYLLLLIVILPCCSKKTPSVEKTETPFTTTEPIKERFQPLSITEIKPEGWLKAQLQENLNGFTGNLDQLVPDLIIKDDIYGKDRLTRKIKSKDVGALGDAGDWQVQFLWWNSETQSNWRDGYIRSAILMRDLSHLKRLEGYISKILATQDRDGYIGIYDDELRYRFDNENGELWAKSSLLRGLLAWYEYKNDPKILNVIERAVQNLMDNYPLNNSHPFYSKKPDVGGTSHGLTITDVFERLYRLTGNEAYRTYCLFLYKDFSAQNINEDAQYAKLINDGIALTGHGVHTYEHLRSVAAAYYASGNPALKYALDKFLAKIKDETTASGAAVGDEWIGGTKADATTRGYEYCSLHELMHSYIELLTKSGEKSFGDMAEKIFLNAAQGARHPSESCIAYLKSDNSYAMTGGLNGDSSNEKQTRYKYSPVHQDAAVCCVPNAGRITPYYVSSMWMKEDQSLVASLLGPSTISTTLNGQPIVIKEKTNYPFELVINFEVSANQQFNLKIRKPTWATQVKVSEAFHEEEGYIVIAKNWKGTENISIEFISAVITNDDLNQEKYFTYGAMVLALPIKGIASKTKSYPLHGFHDLKYTAKDPLIRFEYIDAPITKMPGKLEFNTTLLNPITKQKHSVTLVPMSQTILRQVTFKNTTP